MHNWNWIDAAGKPWPHTQSIAEIAAEASRLSGRDISYSEVQKHLQHSVSGERVAGPVWCRDTSVMPYLYWIK